MKSAEEVIWWVLKAIKRELELQEYGLLTVIRFDLEGLTSKDPNSPSIEDARKVVYLLEKKYKALEIADIDNPKERKAQKKDAPDYHPTRGNAMWFVFEIPDRKKFDDIYSEYKEKLPKDNNKSKQIIDLSPKMSLRPAWQELSTPTIVQLAKETIPNKDNATKLTKRDLRKKLNIIIKNGRFGPKERNFLKFLAKDFEPKTIKEIAKEVSTKACPKLKASVQRKLKNTGFNIKTDKGGWGRKATYQLEYLLSSENS